MKPFLILQARPETAAADEEFAAFLARSGLEASDTERVRMECEPIPGDLTRYSGVIIGGGPGCVSDSEKSEEEARIESAALSAMPSITESDLPFLGCCYGLGILAHHLGGSVSKERYGEPVGPVACTLSEGAETDPLIAGLPTAFDAFVGHKEAVQVLPPGCVHLVASDPCPFQMIRYRENVYAVQFHPEADDEVFVGRIRLYRNRGYFPPEDADRLIAECRAASVTVPEQILRRFVARYRQ